MFVSEKHHFIMKGENRIILSNIFFKNYCLFKFPKATNCSVGWGFRILRLHLCRGLKPAPCHNECPDYNTKQSDGDVPVMLELWGIWSTLSLPSLPGPLWPRVVAPDRVRFMSNRTKLHTYAKLNCVK